MTNFSLNFDEFVDRISRGELNLYDDADPQVGEDIDEDNEMSFFDEKDEQKFFKISADVHNEFIQASTNHKQVICNIDNIHYDTDINLESSLDLLIKAEYLRESINYNGPIDYVHYEKDNSVYAESGDDYIYAGVNPLIALFETVLAEKLFDAKISIKDTFISSEMGFYTGKSLLVPKDSSETIDRVVTERHSFFKDAPIIDIGPQRVILPVVSQKLENSTSLEGKLNLLARTSAYSKGTSDEWYQEKASIFQDVLLGVGTQGTKFPYLPISLGGYDKQVPFLSKNNIERSIRWYKRGTYRPLINTIVFHAYRVSRPLLKGPVPKSEFLDKVKKMYSGWQPWYVNYNKQLPSFSSMLPYDMVKYCIGSYGESFYKDSAIRRLAREGLVVSENQLVVANEVQGYVEALLDPLGIKDFKENRKLLEKQFRSETAFSNSFSSLFSDYINVTVVADLNEDEKNFMMCLNKENTNNVAKFMHKEKYFTSEALDSIYIKGPQKVSMVLLKDSFSTMLVEKKSFGEQILMVDDEELEVLYNWLLEEGVEPPPRDLLEDDEIIYQKIKDSIKPELLDPGIIPSIIIVTDDKKLCYKINRELGVVVFRLPTLLYLKYENKQFQTKLLEGEGDDIKEFIYKALSIDSRLRFFQSELDTGSVSASLLRQHRKEALVVFEDRRTQNFTVRDTANIESRAKGMYQIWPLPKQEFIYDYEQLLGLAFNATSMKSTIFEVSETYKELKSYSLLAPQKKGSNLLKRTKTNALEILEKIRLRLGVKPKPESVIRAHQDVFKYENMLKDPEREKSSSLTLAESSSSKKKVSRGFIQESVRIFRSLAASNKG